MAESKEKFPEHQNPLPQNEDIEKQKYELRKKAEQARKNSIPGEQLITLLSGEEKMAIAVKFILEKIKKSKLPARCEEKLKELVEAQLTRNK